ncbi:unnamed protein product, partial [Staurois parvus]
MWSMKGLIQGWATVPSSCCRTTSPTRHCKTNSYEHGSQRQRHDGTCSSPSAGGPQFPTPGAALRLFRHFLAIEQFCFLEQEQWTLGLVVPRRRQG